MGEIGSDTNGMKKAIDTVPQLYDDGLKPALASTGKDLGLVPSVIFVTLEPVRKWVAQREYNVAETKKYLR